MTKTDSHLGQVRTRHVAAEPGGQAQQSHALPRQAWRASCNATPATTSAASGSAHHHPATAFAPSPRSSATERYAQSMVWWLSLVVADEPSASPTFRFARASGGIATSVTTASPIPIQLTLGR